MSLTVFPAPVRRSVTVNVAPEKAFEVFTSGFARWWPSSNKIGASAYKSSVMEPRAGGRWYEIGEDGSECDWGEVLEWEPPHRLVLAWRIGADWRFHPQLLTEVEVRFAPLADGATRVDLEHRKLENMGPQAEAVRGMLDSDGGWGNILVSFAAAAEAKAEAHHSDQ